MPVCCNPGYRDNAPSAVLIQTGISRRANCQGYFPKSSPGTNLFHFPGMPSTTRSTFRSDASHPLRWASEAGYSADKCALWRFSF